MKANKNMNEHSKMHSMNLIISQTVIGRLLLSPRELRDQHHGRPADETQGLFPLAHQVEENPSRFRDCKSCTQTSRRLRNCAYAFEHVFPFLCAVASAPVIDQAGPLSISLCWYASPYVSSYCSSGFSGNTCRSWKPHERSRPKIAQRELFYDRYKVIKRTWFQRKACTQIGQEKM